MSAATDLVDRTADSELVPEPVPVEVVDRAFLRHPRLAELLRLPAPRQLTWRDIDEVIRYRWGLMLYGIFAPAIGLWSLFWCGLAIAILTGVLPAKTPADLLPSIVFVGGIGITPLTILLFVIYRQVRFFRLGCVQRATIQEITLNSTMDEQLWSFHLRYIDDGMTRYVRYRLDDEAGTIGPIDEQTAQMLYATQAPILILVAGKSVKWLAWPGQLSPYRK